MQKFTHDFDYITYLLGLEPVSICAMDSKQIFKGDKPAGKKCIDCDEYKTCTESPFVIKNYRFGYVNEKREAMSMCAFAVDTGNQDSGSAIIRYSTGMHAVYSQNFFARKDAAARGARFIGYDGTMEFDWYTNELKVFSHSKPVVEKHTVDVSNMDHMGGDRVLSRNFLDVINGAASSCSPLEAGILSAYACLMAEESSRTNKFMDIDYARL